MALFSRRPKSDDPQSEPEASAEVGAEEAMDAADAASTRSEGTVAEEATAASVPHVPISVSTYGKPITKPAAPAAEAPAKTETVPGLPDNTVLKAALAALPEKPVSRDIMNIMRQALHGTLYVRVRGDAKALLAEGKDLTLAVSEIEGKRFLLAFTGGEGLQASIRSDGDTATSAVGQPAQNVLRNVVAGPYEGLILDHASQGRRIILPKTLVEKALEEADPGFTIKNLLTAPRSAETASKVAEALTSVKFWVAAGKSPGAEKLGLAELRNDAGERHLQIFSHPLEALSYSGLGGIDAESAPKPLPLTAEQLGKAIAADAGITGILIDPAGPWIKLSRDDLAPVLALA